MPDSPLRYPGGKAKLAPILAQTIALNDLTGCAYFEPFAGGAGAALRLLRENVVSELHLNDLDPRIYHFWRAALNESQRFAEKILSVPLTVEEWQRQRQICMEADESNSFDLGFSTFFLNRCNRSGIIVGAGPIGGYEQAGIWRLDARFNRENLACRITRLAEARGSIFITQMDAKEFLVKHLPKGNKRKQVFVYLDPPYYSKGGNLYMNSYGERGHRDLARYMQRQRLLKWIASYDDTDFIRNHYSFCKISHNSLQYSLQEKRQAEELLITPSQVALAESDGISTSLATAG